MDVSVCYTCMGVCVCYTCMEVFVYAIHVWRCVYAIRVWRCVCVCYTCMDACMLHMHGGVCVCYTCMCMSACYMCVGVGVCYTCVGGYVCYMCVGTQWDQRHWFLWSWDSNSDFSPPFSLLLWPCSLWAPPFGPQLRSFRRAIQALKCRGISPASENFIKYILMVFTSYPYPLAPPRSSLSHFDVFFF